MADDTTDGTKSGNYTMMQAQLAALFAGERDGLANAANFAAFLFERLPDLNWAGFYFLRDRELVLGPFQGDVHEFPGHIACDAASRAEIVVPLLRDNRLIGVLDLDSPRPARFDADDAAGLRSLTDLLLAMSDFDTLVR
jgi:GAF domain-containing protein